MANIRPRPLILAILDGWGHRSAHSDNAITEAHLPNWNHWWQHAPHTLLECAGPTVGLPPGQMGNSEVGHMHLAAGRILYQDLTRIELDIESGAFAELAIWKQLIAAARQSKARIHLLGLLSPGGVHSHERHFYALLTLLAKEKIGNVVVHAILDGRDTPPQSAMASLQTCQAMVDSLDNAHIGSIMGRYFAMDRDARWDRIEKAYDALTLGKTDFQATTAESALNAAYQRGETDEFVTPTLCAPIDSATLRDGDILVFMNFRADRARELSRALVDNDFSGFQRQRRIQLSQFVTMTQYAEDISSNVAYAPISTSHSFGEIIAGLGLKQCRIAETEKYAHVTFFFNGGREAPFQNEDRILIPSPKVTTYDLQPEMSAPEITTQVITAIESKKYDVIILNFANADMVGHTGDLAATKKAVECLDACLAKIKSALQQVGGEMIITADHGNAEQLFDDSTQQPHTAHTQFPIPFVYLGRKATITAGTHSLVDIAPTLLTLMGIPIPDSMTGHSIVSVTNE